MPDTGVVHQPSAVASGSATWSDLLVDLAPLERVRLGTTLSALPQDIERALEIGFNDFRVTRALARIAEVVSIDLPRPVHDAPADAALVFANLRALPFRDESFDVVVCTEVLEHLDDATLTASIRELRRISGRYVLVTVPCEQEIGNEIFRCSRCGHEEQCMGHLRRVAGHDLASWFSGWDPVTLQTVGTVTGYAPAWLYGIGRRVGNVWFDYWTGRCPRCGAEDSRTADNAAGWVLRRALWRLQGRAAERPAWLLAVFAKRDSDAPTRATTDLRR